MAKETSKPLLRRVPQPVDTPLSRYEQSGFDKGRHFYISNDGQGLADALSSLFIEKGLKSTVVDTPNEIGADCDGLIFLSALRDFSDLIESTNMNRVAFSFAKKVAPKFSKADHQSVFIVVQDTGGYFSYDGGCDPVKAPLGGFAGLAKTASQEWNNALVRSIDLDAGYRNVIELAEILFEEIRFGYEIEVGLPEGKRITLHNVETKVNPPTSRINEKSVVLASGGARGVTAACLLELAKESGASFALLGRSPLVEEQEYLVSCVTDSDLKKAIVNFAKSQGQTLSPKEMSSQANRILRSREIRETLKRMKSLGCKAQYYAVDVMDVEKLHSIGDKIREDLGPISVLVHGAGVLADKSIVDKSEEDFDWVFDTKVLGFYSMSAISAADPIDTICIFSSVAGRFGNVGQTDYAMANEVLNKVAQVEAARRVDCVVKSLAWGPWGGGMVGPALRRMFESRGVSVIDMEAGAKQFVNEVLEASGQVVEVVLGSGLTQIAARLEEKKSISLVEYPFLVDHYVKKKAVVPMVFAMEWMLSVAHRHLSTRLQGKRILLGDLKVLKGLHLPLKGNVEITISSELKDGQLELRIEKSGELFYQSIARLVNDDEKVTHVTIPKFTRWEGKIYDGRILFHGPSFHFLESLSDPVSSSVWSSIDRPSSKWLDTFQTDVVGVDAALQLGVRCASEVTKGLVVPTSFGGYEEKRRTSPAFIHAKLIASTSTSATFDFYLLDENETLVSKLSGVRFQVYEKR